MNNSVKTKKAEVRKNMENVFESATKKIQNIISVCPEWLVEDVSSGYKSLKVYLKLKNVAKDMRMEIRYQAKVGRIHEESFETDIATYGNFALLENSDELVYYTAVGDVLNHKDMLSFLKEIMVFYTKKITELKEEYDKLDKED